MNDDDLQLRVIEHLRWEPGIESSQIGVTVREGVITLLGEVDSAVARARVVKTAARTRGVKGFHDRLNVVPDMPQRHDDDEVAKRLRKILSWNVAIPEGKVKVEVTKGHVFLSGKVEWDYQRKAAEKMVWMLPSVAQVTNHISLDEKVVSEKVAADITNALRRQARLDADDIAVSVQGDTVVLSGTVKSVADRRLVEKSVWSAPGVKTIINKLAVNDPEAAILFPLAG